MQRRPFRRPSFKRRAVLGLLAVRLLERADIVRLK
jgi:hypothetical protein